MKSPINVSSETMKDDNIFKAVQEQYRQESHEQPSDRLEQVIFSAAQQSVGLSRVQQQKNGWVERWLPTLKFPAILAGASMMTLVVAQLILPLVQGPMGKSVNIERIVASPSAGVEYVDMDSLNSPLSESAISVPPSRVASGERKAKAIELFDMPESEVSQSQFEKASEKELERRVLEIKQLAQAGDFLSMNQKIAELQQRYPDFPIFEEIRPLLK